MSQTSVTICIPCHRARRFLPETLDSVAEQTHLNWEMILVEDGPSEPIDDLVEAFSARVRQPVQLIKQKENRGVSATRNTAIQAARTAWIAILDADDLWLPNHLEACLATAEETGAPIVHSGSVLFQSETGEDFEIRAPTQDDLARFPISLYQGSYIIQPSSVLLHKDLWEAAGGFDTSFNYCEDVALWFRCARRNARFAFNGTITCRYRRHGTGLTSRARAMSEAHSRLYEMHRDWEAIPQPMREDYRSREWAAYGKLSWRQDPATARKAFAKALSIRWNIYWFLRMVHAGLLSMIKPSPPGSPHL